MFSDEPVQHEEKIFGGRYKDIKVECEPPQKVSATVRQPPAVGAQLQWPPRGITLAGCMRVGDRLYLLTTCPARQQLWRDFCSCCCRALLLCCQVVLDGELLGETPVHARVKPASLKVIIPPPPVAAETDDKSAESAEGQGDEKVNEEGNGTASQPDGAPASPIVENSVKVEDKPIVAPEPKK